MLRIMAMAGLMLEPCAAVWAAPAPWWKEGWQFRAEVPRHARGPNMEMEANFTALLNGTGSFEPASLRLVVTRADGQAALARLRWEPLAGYDAASAAVGRVTARLPERTEGRRLHLYFGTLEQGPWEAGPLLQPVPTGNEALTDGGFEHLGEAESPWEGIGSRFEPAAEAHAGKQSAACKNPAEDAVSGVFQQVQLDQEQPFTLVITGWSRAENVSGDPDAHYSLWADLQYTDGTYLYGQSAAFDCGTHDWQRREVVIHPARPVRWVKIFGLFRRHSGRAWFDELSLRQLERCHLYAAERLEADGRVRAAAAQAARQLRIATEDGLSLGFEAVSGAVAEVKLGERAWTDAVAWPHSGLCLRDAAQDALPLPVGGKLVETEQGARQEGGLAGLDLEAEAEFIARAECIEVAGEVRDLTGEDRCVDVIFRLPIAPDGKRWGGGLRVESDASVVGTYAETVRAAGQDLPRVPFCSLADESEGLSLAIRMDEPAAVTISYQHEAQVAFLQVKFCFGLTKAAKKFPGRAPFRFYLYRPEGRWGFRAAARKYYQLFPEFFEVHAERQGCWFFGTMDPTNIAEPDDFMLVFDEGPHDIAWNRQHGAYSFATTNAQEQWIVIGDFEEPEPSVPSYEDCVAAMQGWGKEIVEGCAAHDEHGKIQWTSWHNQVWGGVAGNAKRWMRCTMVNADPELPGLNVWQKRNEWYDKTVAKWAERGQELDGIYIDQVILVGTENYRRDHFAYADRPLPYSTRTMRPVLPVWLSSAEHYWAWYDKMRGEGKLMMANIPPHGHSFYAWFFDVIGSEVSPSRQRAADTDLRRTLGYQKPISLLMEWHWEHKPIISAEEMEAYINRCLFWAIFPGISNAGPEGGMNYWQHPELYERDRASFRKYLPAIHKMALAGWEPITYAVCEPREVWVERYGPDAESRVYFTLRSEGQARAGRLLIDLGALGISPEAKLRVRDLVGSEEIEARREGGTLSVPVEVGEDRSEAVVVEPLT